jgi:hypothetical protein
MDDQQVKREKRMNAFNKFADAIEMGESAESIVKKGLNIT